MSLVQASNISLQFENGDKLFSGISCQLHARRVGLVGRNGVGKTLFAAVLAKQIEPSLGTVKLQARTQVYSQLPISNQFNSVTIAEFLGVNAVLEALEKVAAGHCEPYWFDIIGEQWQLESELHALLTELGLPPDSTQLYGALSGGQQARLQLWKLFQSDAELLILDEPSNHLDRGSKHWLVDQLARFSGHVLLISHDRTLLRGMEQIWELSSLGLTQYGGNYDFYVEQKAQEVNAVDRQLKTVQREEKMLAVQAQRNREKADKRAAKGKQMRKQGGMPKIVLNAMRSSATASESGRVKQQQSQRENVQHKIQLLQQRREQLKPLTMSLRDVEAKKAGLVSIINGVLPFGVSCVLNLDVSTKDKVHIQGDNGSGKSTLLKAIRGSVSLTQGEIKVNAPVYYLDQYFGLLLTEQSMLENITYFCLGMSETEARTLLAGIGFRRDDVHRRVSVLSGGEKMKLAMLVVSHQADQPLLLLDEPDNHLDIASKLVLAEALNRFSGAFLLISHDDEFAAECGVTKTLSLSHY
ncbi:ABC-F family ATP-binding cassette domain-containing protein [Photobacterium nomapromontoriensis]|uniref:ABC-F family ATP-binding cassette domain-containing protein n=1 Tax=Photobacterium nomapromontoriensis TaxID=2910237 RepID=UPI003D101F6C